MLRKMQRVVEAETKLLKQKELLGETERNIEELDDSMADLRKRISPSPRVSPRHQSVDEEMFIATEELESESGDEPARVGLVDGKTFQGRAAAKGVGEGGEQHASVSILAYYT